MIDIYSDGPYINILPLLLSSIPEVLQYLASLSVCSFYFWTVKRFLSGSLKKVAVFILPLLHIYYVFSVSIKSEFLYSLCLALLISLQLGILQLLPFHMEDYVLMLCLVLFPSRLFNSTSAIVGILWIFVILFLALYTTAKISMKHLNGNHFSCYFLFIALSISAYVFHLSCFFLPSVLLKDNYIYSFL